MDFRCAAASSLDGLLDGTGGAEPLAGSAPEESDWLFVEYAGSWGRKALAESRLAEEVKVCLDSLPMRVQLIRRHGGSSGPGVRVFTARVGSRPELRSATLGSVEDLLTTDLTDLAAYDGLLWTVCTNGRRDLCCAELGRPIAAALAKRWPDETWETTHLGGHRFAGTLLALPSGLTLGRLDPATAITACEEIEAGRVPELLTRGRAGLSGAEQVAELHLRAELGFSDVRVHGREGDQVLLVAGGERWQVEVTCAPGEPRRQSCADEKTKRPTAYSVVGASRVATYS